MKQRKVSIYEKWSTEDLRTLLSKKKLSLQNMERFDSFFTRREADKFRSQISKIEVELTARFFQQKLPL